MSTTRSRRSHNPRRYRPGLITLETRVLLDAGDVTTFHDDGMRSGANTSETTLTPANVNAADFGKVGTFATDGKVDAEPLYVSNVAIPGQGTHNVVYVATENDSIYAFDAQTGEVLWHDGPSGTPTSLLGANETSINTSLYFPFNSDPLIGILSTPVIDAATGTLYVITESVDATGSSPTFFQRIHAIDIATGQERVTPRSIDSSILQPGTGPNSNGTDEVFTPELSRSRAALALSDGVVYVGWTSNSGVHPYEGWITAFDENTLSLLAFRSMDQNNQPIGGDSSGNSIWMSGGGLAVDAAGDIYAVTGNGPFDPSIGNYGDSVVKFSPASQGLNVIDYFSPYNQGYLAANDLDLGSSGIVLLPPVTNAYGYTLNLAVNSGKDGNIYVTNTDDLGGNQPQGNAIYQEIEGGLSGLSLSSPIYFNNSVYLNSIGYGVDAYTIDQATGQFGPTPTSVTSTDFIYPGTTPSISADGTADAILWAMNMSPTGTAVLHAYDAYNLADELYNSSQAANGRDQFGPDSAFVTPMISHGRVYVGTPTGVVVFGLLNQASSSDPVTSPTPPPTTTTNPPMAPPPPVPPPTVLVPAFGSSSFIAGGADLLGAVGADSTYGESALTYTWSVVSTPQGVGAPPLQPSGTNESKLIAADITAPGSYVFRVLIASPDGQAVTSDVAVTATLPPVVTTAPAFSSPGFFVGGTDLLGAVGQQEFVAPSQLTYTWSVVSQPAGAPAPTFGTNGTSASGLVPVAIAAPGAYGFRVTIAGPDGQTATSQVAVIASIPQVAITVPAVASAAPYIGGPLLLAVGAKDQAFADSALTYTWATILKPANAKAPAFAANGTNAAKLTSVSVKTPGLYAFEVTVKNPFSQVTRSIVDVQVAARPTSVVKIRTTGGPKKKA